MEIIPSKKFKKKFKKYRNNKNMLRRFMEFVSCLKDKNTIPKSFYDHKLKGKYSKFREAHILPDLCIIYRVVLEENAIILRDIDSHANLFK